MENPYASLTFEQAMAQLEQIAAQLDAGDLSLEDTVACYEKGVALHKRCAQLLQDAKNRVSVLMNEQGEWKEKDWEETEC